MPTTPSPEPGKKKPSIRAIQILLDVLYMGENWTTEDLDSAQDELNALRVAGVVNDNSADQ